MKIAFVGKGGSGKTTLAALFARHLAADHHDPLAIDADVNQHLAVALGESDDRAALIPPLGEHLTDIKEYLRGTNPRIASAAAMVKTTPPGRGSRLLRLDEPNPIYGEPVASASRGPASSPRPTSASPATTRRSAPSNSC
jgi:CO dehydrogenase maturation factor